MLTRYGFHPIRFSLARLTRWGMQGAAAMDGRLAMGDKLLVVNGVSMAGLTHQGAVEALQGACVRLPLPSSPTPPRGPSVLCHLFGIVPLVSYVLLASTPPTPPLQSNTPRSESRCAHIISLWHSQSHGRAAHCVPHPGGRVASKYWHFRPAGGAVARVGRGGRSMQGQAAALCGCKSHPGEDCRLASYDAWDTEVKISLTHMSPSNRLPPIPLVATRLSSRCRPRVSSR